MVCRLFGHRYRWVDYGGAAMWQCRWCGKVSRNKWTWIDRGDDPTNVDEVLRGRAIEGANWNAADSSDRP